MCATPTDPAAGNPAWHLPGIPATGLHGATIDTGAVLGEMLRRASSPGFGTWWRRAESVGFCAHPIQLVGTDPFGRQHTVWTRCNNRRASVCPSCSDLYARDTWQLVHAGAAGGHHNIPATVATHPQVFTTLTAPSFGPVHHATGTTCRDHQRGGGFRRCPHRTPLWCSRIHDRNDTVVGQPLCPQCYDYRSHVLFTWHMPELWRRFTIALRRAVQQSLKSMGAEPDSVRVSFVKVVEMQARAVPHIHALIRLDPTNTDDTDTTGNPGTGPAEGSGTPSDHIAHGRSAFGATEPRHHTRAAWQSPITAPALAVLIQHSARQVHITVPNPSTTDTDTDTDTDIDGARTALGTAVVRFGHHIDTQPVSTPPSADHATTTDTTTGTYTTTVTDPDPDADTRSPLSPRRVARYLAKYVTKSLQDFGIAARRLSAESIATLDVSEHVRAIMATIATLSAAGSAKELAGIGRWLHTLGYRGHITTKSRRYSVTMTTLRTTRAQWTRTQHTKHAGTQDDPMSVGLDQAMEPIGWEFDRAGHATAGDRVLTVSASLRHIAARLAGLDQRHPTSAGPVAPDG